MFTTFYISYIFVRPAGSVQKTLLMDIYIIAANVGPFSLELLLQFRQEAPLFSIDGSLYVFFKARAPPHAMET